MSHDSGDARLFRYSAFRIIALNTKNIKAVKIVFGILYKNNTDLSLVPMQLTVEFQTLHQLRRALTRCILSDASFMTTSPSLLSSAPSALLPTCRQLEDNPATPEMRCPGDKWPPVLPHRCPSRESRQPARQGQPTACKTSDDRSPPRGCSRSPISAHLRIVDWPPTTHVGTT